MKFKFDLQNEFRRYQDSQGQYHEAAYDAFMTGYVFAKICKYKEIDAIFLRNKKNDQKKMYKRNNKNKGKTENFDEE